MSGEHAAGCAVDVVAALDIGWAFNFFQTFHNMQVYLLRHKRLGDWWPLPAWGGGAPANGARFCMII